MLINKFFAKVKNFFDTNKVAAKSFAIRFKSNQSNSPNKFSLATIPEIYYANNLD